MELAWQKEREEQQKLLQETATLARDLQQTLLEVNIMLFLTFTILFNINFNLITKF